MIGAATGDGDAQGEGFDIAHVVRIRLRQALDRDEVVSRLGREERLSLRALGKHRAKSAAVGDVFDEIAHALEIAPAQRTSGQVVADQPALVELHRPGDDAAR